MNNYEIGHICGEICNELEHAIAKHPGFTTDLIHQVAIMAEEAGEAIQAANDGDIEQVKKELLQTAAMCVRVILNMREERNENTLG